MSTNTQSGSFVVNIGDTSGTALFLETMLRHLNRILRIHTKFGDIKCENQVVVKSLG